MLIDFLLTRRPKTDLIVALDVLREFKKGESHDEFVATSFAAWAKLEQLEEFLEHLVHGAALEEDTIQFLKAHGYPTNFTKND